MSETKPTDLGTSSLVCHSTIHSTSSVPMNAEKTRRWHNLFLHG